MLTAILASQGCALVRPVISDTVEWRNFESRIDDRRLQFRFPVETSERIRFQSYPEPVVDPYTKAISIIGMQVGLDVDWRNITSDYTIALGLSSVWSSQIGIARSAQELNVALEESYAASLSRADGALSAISDREIVRLSEREWVRWRFVDSRDGSVVQWDDYRSRWNDKYLLTYHVRYGSQLNNDPVAIAVLKRRVEESLSSFRITSVRD